MHQVGRGMWYEVSTESKSDAYETGTHGQASISQQCREDIAMISTYIFYSGNVSTFCHSIGCELPCKFLLNKPPQ